MEIAWVRIASSVRGFVHGPLASPRTLEAMVERKRGFAGAIRRREGRSRPRAARVDVSSRYNTCNQYFH
jgi:hypothetical protein